MTEELLGRGDPIMERLQWAFAHEEPAVELTAVLQRAARYQAGEPPAADDHPGSGHGLTAADLDAARRREPAAITRIYTAYAPALFRFFLAAVGDRHQAEDLTGNAFLSAIEALPRFRGPAEALGGWLFQIARHDLYDHRRRQARSHLQPLEDQDQAAAVTAAVGPETPDKDIAIQPLPALQAVLDHQGLAPPAMPQQPLRGLLGIGDRVAHGPLNRLSPREREVLALLGRGWSNAQIGRELSISPHTVRTHIQNILQKLELHSKLEAASFAMQHGSASAAEYRPASATELLEDPRLLAALGRLPADQREVLLLRMAAGLTAAEVAAVVGKSVGVVKVLQHRAQARLVQLLQHQHPEPSDDP